ncbi:MAG: hypothetical protein JWL88_50 [Parcubacteria group bacterium]|nr:hypothetical protein [Parcubacteria group bacterium]
MYTVKQFGIIAAAAISALIVGACSKHEERQASTAPPSAQSASQPAVQSLKVIYPDEAGYSVASRAGMDALVDRTVR